MNSTSNKGRYEGGGMASRVLSAPSLLQAQTAMVQIGGGSGERVSVCPPLATDASWKTFGVNKEVLLLLQTGEEEEEGERETAWCHFSWNAGVWPVPSGELTHERRRYMALIPLNWGTRSDFGAMLSRDLLTGDLVMIRRYCYRHNTKRSRTHIDTDEEPTDDSLVPFTVAWKRRIRSLVGLRHAHVNPVMDVLMDEEQQELLLVHPYIDGMLPLAFLSQPHPHLLPRKMMTPVWLNCILREIMAGVLFLHRHGIVHGALSTWTVLLDAKGHASVVSLAASGTPPNTRDVASTGGVVVHQTQMSPGSQCRIPSEASDAFSIGVLLLDITRQELDTSYDELREAAMGMMHEDPEQRMTVTELAAALDAAVSPQQQLHPDSRGVGVQLQETGGQPPPPPPDTTSTTTATASPDQLQPQEPKVPPISGILQRVPSPVLYRTTGLQKWQRLKAAAAEHRGRFRTSTQRRKGRRVRRAISIWRVAVMAVVFCVALISRWRVKQEVLASRLLLTEQRQQQQQVMQQGVAAMAPTPLTPRPRRPTFVHRRHSRDATSTIVVQRDLARPTLSAASGFRLQERFRHITSH